MGCCFSSASGPPAEFSLGEPEGFRKVQGWDASQQKIVTASGGGEDGPEGVPTGSAPPPPPDAAPAPPQPTQGG